MDVDHRPDLDEFLSALSGFLDKQTSPQDPSHARFLTMFCRSIGATDGQFLQQSENGKLTATVSCGVTRTFEEDFLRACQTPGRVSPLEEAFQKKEVIAIIDLKKTPQTASWFVELMTKHNFNSLVAVPLLGASQTVGVLAAYYHDVCLFDRNTVDHLMVLGRMVGAATEKSLAAGQSNIHAAQEKITDEFLNLLVEKSLTEEEIYRVVGRLVSEALKLDGMLCGPMRSSGPGFVLASKEVPPFIADEFLGKPVQRLRRTWNGIEATFIGLAFVRHKKIYGGLIGWKGKESEFNPADLSLSKRLIKVASLVLGDK